jgi:hypothetical protein
MIQSKHQSRCSRDVGVIIPEIKAVMINMTMILMDKVDSMHGQYKQDMESLRFSTK